MATTMTTAVSRPTGATDGRNGMAIPDELPPNIDSARCASRQALDLIADKWVVLIVRGLADGPVRGAELRRRISGISQRMFTRTVREMERDGLVARVVEPTVPPRVTYSLTPLGESLRTPLAALTDWAERHLSDVRVARARHESAVHEATVSPLATGE
jgi:DNA-binding HxlR family transcriptional regulator